MTKTILNTVQTQVETNNCPSQWHTTTTRNLYWCAAWTPHDHAYATPTLTRLRFQRQCMLALCNKPLMRSNTLADHQVKYRSAVQSTTSPYATVICTLVTKLQQVSRKTCCRALPCTSKLLICSHDMWWMQSNKHFMSTCLTKRAHMTALLQEQMLQLTSTVLILQLHKTTSTTTRGNQQMFFICFGFFGVRYTYFYSNRVQGLFGLGLHGTKPNWSGCCRKNLCI